MPGIFDMSMPGIALLLGLLASSGPIAPTLAIDAVTCWAPAWSKVSVTGTVCPSLSGAFSPVSIR